MFGKTSKRNLFVSAFAVLTVGSMALFFNLYEPWQPAGPELIPDGSFSTPSATNRWSGWNEWTRLVPDGGFGGSPGVVLTCSSNRHGILRFTTYNLTHIPAFRVSLRAAAQGIVRGQDKYNAPRAIFFYHDAQAKSLFNLRHGVINLSKDTSWRRYKGFFPVPDGAADARLHIQNFGSDGVMRVDDISVLPVRERPSSPWWKLFFGILWTSAFSLCLFTLRPWARRYGIPLLLTSALILTGILLPGAWLDGAIEKTVQTAKSLVPRTAPSVSLPAPQPAKAPPAKPKEETLLNIRSGTAVDQAHKTGHLALFSLLAFLVSLSWIGTPPALRRAVEVLCGLVLFAAATETLQFVTADRAAAWSDLRIDLIGMTGAVILVFALRWAQCLIRRD
jgi:hypothetical protein